MPKGSKKNAAALKAATSARPKQSGSVLIIEDDEFLAKMIARVLEGEGLQCELAGNGREGLRKAQSVKPKLIILDVILPDLDGFSILGKLKAAKATSRIPVVIVSNLGQEEDVQQGLQLGAKDYIVKSDLSLDAMVAKVKKYLK
ncbi:MAG: response regulator [Patescibacteria group bacterium]|nr:response regulator [Patescibacteria group bacterium]